MLGTAAEGFLLKGTPLIVNWCNFLVFDGFDSSVFLGEWFIRRQRKVFRFSGTFGYFESMSDK